MQDELPKNEENESIIKKWIPIKYDRITLRQVKENYYRVNLYESVGDVVKRLKMIKSYFLYVNNNNIEDKTL